MLRLKLASRLGRTLHELEQTMTAAEFGIWQAYEEVTNNPIEDDYGQ